MRERRGRKDTDQTAGSAACSAHFEIQLTCAVFSTGGCPACVFSASSLSHSRLWKRKQSVTLNHARLLVSAYQRRMGCVRTTACHNTWRLTHSASMRASAIGIPARYAPSLSHVYTSNIPLLSFKPILSLCRQMSYFLKSGWCLA